MTSRAGGRRRQWAMAAALWVGLFGVYVSNGREIGASDTVPSVLLPIAMLRGDGVTLDRFRRFWPDSLPYYVTEKRGVILSRYPLGPSLLAVPFTAAPLALLDRRQSDWEREPARAFYWARKLGKISAAAQTALTGAALYLLLCALDLATVALPATLIAALGSNLWMTGSQSLWQHGPAALALTLALLLAVPRAPSRLRLFLAGGACAALVYCRPQDVLLAGLVLLAVARRDGVRAVLWFVPLPVLLGALLVAYNEWYFGRLLGGYGEMLALTSPATHGNTQLFAEDVPGAILGTLLSPSRGLFIFTPWVPLALLALPAVWPRLRACTVLTTALLGLPIFFAQLVLQSSWWAGWSFGPRYWTDVMPLFAVVLAFALDWARRRSPRLLAALAAAGVAAILVQAIGAFCYPSSFNAVPGSIDHQHDRLWTWRDGELARCIREGPHRWE